MSAGPIRTAPVEPAGTRFAGMSLCDVFQESVARFGDRVALRTADDGTTLTFAEYGDAVRGVAGELHRRGVRDGDTVGLMIANRPEFYVMDSAALHLGATPYSIYLTLSPEQIAFQIENGKPRIVICDEDRLENLLAAGVERDRIIVLGESGDSIESLVASGREHEHDFEATWRAVTPDHVATIIYTSGTTGDPKGVEISHLNALATAEAVNGALHFPDNSRVVSYLPLAHVAERNNSHWMGMAFGFSVTTCPEPGRVAEHLPGVRPIWFFGVPRVFEKIKAAAEASMDPATAAALERALKRLPDRDVDPTDRRLLDAVRRDIGLDEAASVNVGAAPAVPEVIDFYHAIGVELAELWGMSELCGSGTVNPAGAIRTGTAGPPMPGVEIRLAEDGEIQARCPGMTRGYRGRPDLTAELFTPDGWAVTGDIGTIDEDGYLSIVGRKKELIINAGGKNMSPAFIEAQIKGESLLVGQVVAIGDLRPYNVALIVLDPDHARVFAERNGLEGLTVEELAEHPLVKAEIDGAVERGNARLSRVESIKKYALLGREWVPGGEELTPTMKLKRRAIHEIYSDRVEALYAG